MFEYSTIQYNILSQYKLFFDFRQLTSLHVSLMFPSGFAKSRYTFKNAGFLTHMEQLLSSLIRRKIIFYCRHWACKCLLGRCVFVLKISKNLC